MNELIIVEREDLVAVADAVRDKTGITEELTLGGMITGINSISQSSGIDTSDATATADDIATGKTAYVDGEKVTGTHECSGDGYTPELITISWQTVKDSNCNVPEDVVVDVEYYGLDETNTITQMKATGTSGTIQCFKWHSIMFSTHPQIATSGWVAGEEYYPNIVSVSSPSWNDVTWYAGSDYSIALIVAQESDNFVLTCQ